MTNYISEEEKYDIMFADIFGEDSAQYIKDFGLTAFIEFICNNKNADIQDLCEMLERTYET